MIKNKLCPDKCKLGKASCACRMQNEYDIRYRLTACKHVLERLQRTSSKKHIRITTIIEILEYKLFIVEKDKNIAMLKEMLRDD